VPVRFVNCAFPLTEALKELRINAHPLKVRLHVLNVSESMPDTIHKPINNMWADEQHIKH
jgi:hypothetical protein